MRKMTRITSNFGVKHISLGVRVKDPKKSYLSFEVKAIIYLSEYKLDNSKQRRQYEVFLSLLSTFGSNFEWRRI